MHQDRLSKAIKNLRTEVQRCYKLAKISGKEGDYVEAIKLNESGQSMEWTLNTLEYYLEHGEMP